jgi:hypothetical protein
VPLLPPELARPFPNERERERARAKLAHRDRTLRAIELLADMPAATWSSSQRAAFPTTTNGVGDPPPQRVGRWASLFAAELTELHRLLAATRPLSDLELHEALYLAGRLLATVSGRAIDSVDDFEIP